MNADPCGYGSTALLKTYEKLFILKEPRKFFPKNEKNMGLKYCTLGSNYSSMTPFS